MKIRSTHSSHALAVKAKRERADYEFRLRREGELQQFKLHNLPTAIVLPFEGMKPSVRSRFAGSWAEVTPHFTGEKTSSVTRRAYELNGQAAKSIGALRMLP